MRKIVAVVIGVAMLGASCSGARQDRVVLAAGTTVVDSGFVGALVEAYVAEVGSTQISVIGLSTQQAFVYAEAGNADVTITHDPKALGSFLDEFQDAVASPVFSSRFALVGPPDIAFGDNSVPGILGQVADRGIPFVSRDDGSGTYVKELSLWEGVGIAPFEEPWYIRTGTGMGATLLVADQRRGVTLTEVGVFLAAADQINLVVIDDGSDPGLDNPYDLTVVAPSQNPAAAAFGAWLVSRAGRSAIREANDVLFGAQVYRVP